MTTENWECLQVSEETKVPGLQQASGNTGDTMLNEMGIGLKLRGMKGFRSTKTQIVEQFLKANDGWLNKCLRHLKQDWTKHG